MRPRLAGVAVVVGTSSPSGALALAEWLRVWMRERDPDTAEDDDIVTGVSAAGGFFALPKVLLLTMAVGVWGLSSSPDSLL